MDNYELALIYNDMVESLIPLEDSHREAGYSLESLINVTYPVYSDKAYKFSIKGLDPAAADTVMVYINDEYNPCTLIGDSIVFYHENTGVESNVFEDCFGMVSILFNIVLKDGKSLDLCTPNLPVIVKQSPKTQKMVEMIQFIYQGESELLKNDIIHVSGNTYLKYGGTPDYVSQLEMAEEIAAVFEENYPFFKSNSRYKTTKSEDVERIEKLQVATSRTVRYVARHPEELKASAASNGIRVGGRFYIPERTLITRNVYTKDIYENRIILSFLFYIFREMEQLKDRTNKLISYIPPNDLLNDNYFYSTHIFFQQIGTVIINNLDRLNQVVRRLEILYAGYSKAFGIDRVDVMTKLPVTTAVFQAVPQYNKLFLCIHKWFHYGSYEFNNELFVTSALKISDVYELYVLVKILKYLKAAGMKLVGKKKYEYALSANSRHKNPYCNNTFIFDWEGDEFIVYYQPVIYMSKHGDNNDIKLVRNNNISISRDSTDRYGYYYVPDYLIKIKKNHKERYLICDAKYTSRKTLLWTLLPDIIFKYLFSISPSDKEVELVGLNLFYGLCPSDITESESIYSKDTKAIPMYSIAKITPISIDVPEQDTEKMIGELISALAM